MSVSPQAGPVTTGFLSVGRLIEHCLPGPGSDDGMIDVCNGYVAGAIDQIIAEQAALPPNKRRVCLTAQATLGDVQRVVMDRLRAMPDQGDVAAAAVIQQAAVEAFPC